MQLTSDEIDLLVKNYGYEIRANASVLSEIINKEGIFSHFSEAALEKVVNTKVEEREWLIDRREMLMKLKNL